MKKLTDYQKEYLLEFFNINQGYPGWKSIAEKLLNTGKCIVAGEDCIWKGGIGNFIKVEPEKNSFKCSVYTFCLDDFLSSEWFKQAKEFEILTLAARIEIHRSKLDDISNL